MCAPTEENRRSQIQRETLHDAPLISDMYPCVWLRQIVLTKADLIKPEYLSACVLEMQKDLRELVGEEAASEVPFSAVCGTSGSGVTKLWKELETM